MVNVIDLDESVFDCFAPLFPKYVMEEAMDDEDVVLFGIVDEDVPIGVISARIMPPEAELLWYYLDPSNRGEGLGSESFGLLCRRLYNSLSVKTVRADIPVDADESIYKLFDPYVETTYERLPECRFEIPAGWVHNSGRVGRRAQKSIALGDLDPKELNILCNNLVKAGMDLVPMPIDVREYNAKLSAIYMDEGKPKGLLLVKTHDDYLYIPYMASTVRNPAVLMDMIYFVAAGTRRVSEDVKIYMNLVDPGLKKVVRALFEIDEDDDDAFTYNTRVALSLNFVERENRHAEETLNFFRKLYGGEI